MKPLPVTEYPGPAIRVGPNQAYRSIQAAIDSVVISTTTVPGNYSPSVPALTENITIECERGVYGGFVIPDASIGTTSCYGLTIKALPGHEVRLNGQFSSQPNGVQYGHGHRYVGVGIGNSVPYVTIKGLIIEQFHKGIVIGQGSTNCTITNCFLNFNINAGIWAYRADRTSIVNNVILDHDNGIILHEVDEAIVLHNDIINLVDHPATRQPGQRTCVHITTKQPDSLNIVGAITLYNNNIESIGGTLLAYGSHVIPKLKSNHNNLYSIGGEFSRELNGPVKTTTLGGWTTVSNNDLSSVSINVSYYSPIILGNSIVTQIVLSDPSAGASDYSLWHAMQTDQAMQGLCNSATAGSATSSTLLHGQLPYYFDTSLSCETVQSAFGDGQGLAVTRPTNVAIGAYDLNYDPGGFATSVVPMDSIGSGTADPSCQSAIYAGAKSVSEKYGQQVDCIVPSVVPGFFYSHDMEYYLYSDKAVYYLSDLSSTEIRLYKHIHDLRTDAADGIVIELNGVKLEKGQYEIKDNKLIVFHKGIDIPSNDVWVSVIGADRIWSNQDNGFTTKAYYQRARLRDGITKYFLPNKPTRGAPIVITDDNVSYSDKVTNLGRHFRLEYSNEYDKIELIFSGPQNLLENPQFDYRISSQTGDIASLGSLPQPESWEASSTLGLIGRIATSTFDTQAVLATGALGTGETASGVKGAETTFTGLTFAPAATGYTNIYPVMGQNFCVLSGSSESSGLGQRIKISDKQNYWLSLYAANISETGNSNRYLTGSIVSNVTFYDINFNSIGTDSTSVEVITDFTESTGLWKRYGWAYGKANDPTIGKVEQTVVTGANSMLSSIIATPSGSYWFDFTLATTGYMAIDATCFSQGMNIDYYTRSYRGKELTIEYDTGTTDLYHVDDLTLTPVRNSNNNGFLHIPAIPSWQFSETSPADTTTLTDWGWPTGRLDHLPWSKISGKNKLRHRGVFPTKIGIPDEDTTVSPQVVYPRDVALIPRVPVSSTIDGIHPAEQFLVTGESSPGVKGTDFIVRVTDNSENPYSFEYVTVTLVDDIDDPHNREFLGLLGIRELGIYTQFNTEITTKTDSNGVVNLRWIPPSSDIVEVEISDPLIQIQSDPTPENLSFIDSVPYRINEVGHGNPFLSSPAKPAGYKTIATGTTTESISPSLVNEGPSNGLNVYKLKSVPYAETTDVYVNSTGLWEPTGTTNTGAYNYDLLLTRVETADISPGEFLVDEARKLIFVNYPLGSNDRQESIQTKYKRRRVFLKADELGIVYEKRLYLTSDLVSELNTDISNSNPLSILYDMKTDIIVTAHSPWGMTYDTVTVEDGSFTGQFVTINARERTLNATLVGKNQFHRVGI